MGVSRDRAPGRMSSMSGADVCFRKLGVDNRWKEVRNGGGETSGWLRKESKGKWWRTMAAVTVERSDNEEDWI